MKHAAPASRRILSARTPIVVGCCALAAAIGLVLFACGEVGFGLRRESRLASAFSAPPVAPGIVTADASTRRGVGRPSAQHPTPGVSEILRELAAGDERTIADLAALLESTGDGSLRRSAAHVLAELGTPSAIAALLNAIAAAPRDQPPDDLLAALGALTNPEAAPALSAFLLRTGEPALVTPVREALARLADGPGVLEIVTAWHEGASERWQQANLEGALLNVRSPAAVPILREILLREDAPVLRSQAALVLGYIGGPESADALTMALASSRSAAFTAAVKESLALLRARALKTPGQPDEPP